MVRFVNLALVLCCAAQTAWGVTSNGRVVGGSEVTPGAYPWQAFVEGVENGVATTGCGATVVSATHVITAAQCLSGSIQIARVYLGAHDISAATEPNRVVMESGVFAIHPEYTTTYFDNDIAVVTLPRPIDVTPYIDMAKLPQGGDITSDFIGTEGIFAGWGSTDGAPGSMSNTLHFSRNTVVAQTECNGHYGDAWMTDKKLCVGTPSLNGPCYGDAGSGLVRESDDTVMGVFSFLDVQTCQSGFAVGFTRVGPYVDWINQQIFK